MRCEKRIVQIFEDGWRGITYHANWHSTTSL